MSCDDYVNYIAQKHTLAVAIAVIKTKPDDKTLEQYIDDLKHNIIDVNMNTDVDITICSDDFNLSDNDVTINKTNYNSNDNNGRVNEINTANDSEINDFSQNSVTILKGFNDNFGGVNENNDAKEQLNDVLHALENIDNDNNHNWSCNFNDYNGFLTQRTACDSPHVNIEYIDVDEIASQSENYTQNQYEIYISNNPSCSKGSNKCVTTIENLKSTIGVDRNDKYGLQTIENESHEITRWFDDSNSSKLNSVTENIKVLSESRNLDISRIRHEENMNFDSQAREIHTVHDSKKLNTSRNISRSNNEENLTFDSQATQIYTVHGFTETSGTDNKSRNLNVSRNKQDPFTDNNVDESRNSVPRCGNENMIFDSQETEIYTVHGFTENNSIDESRNLVSKTIINKNLTADLPATETGVTGNRSRSAIRPKVIKENLIIDTQATEIYTVHGNTDNNESFTNNKNIILDSQATELITANEFVKNSQFDNGLNNSQNENTSFKSNNKSVDIKNSQKPRDYNGNKQFNTEDISKRNDNTNDILKTVDVNIFTDNYTHLSASQDNNFTIPAQYIRKSDDKIDNNEQNLIETDGICENSQTNNDIKSLINDSRSRETNDVSLITPRNDVDTANSYELIPFKVIEELNRVKMFLNKRIDRRLSNDGSIDSGYRSDSQGRSYRNSLQLSGNFVSQSAHCLYEYMKHCPLVANTREITTEISQVLGQLIDRLHSEESYPLFLEELLETINTDLNKLYNDDEVLLKKDENVQRLILLNKSKHISYYTIERITTILEDVHSSLTTDGEPAELTNITQTENLPYIFHMLEIIIKRYIKLRDNTSADMSQDSSQDAPFRRNYITNIWRRKWMPNFDEIKSERSQRTQCVLLKCSEVLNRIIVDTMNRYSLAAFCALQCFNLLQ